MSDPRLFWARVEAQPSGCWEWTGARAGGYGVLNIANRRWGAHRLAWTMVHGPIPAGLWVLHRCDNPPCVRPDHLFLGTASDNAQDAIQKGRYGHRRQRAFPTGADAMPAMSGSDLRQVRERAGVTRAAVARGMGISPATVRDIELFSRRTQRRTTERYLAATQRG